MTTEERVSSDIEDSDADEHEVMDNPNGATVKVYVSPGNSQHFTPHCSPELTPSIGQVFENLETGIEFYRKYASTCGFDTRLPSQSLSLLVYHQRGLPLLRPLHRPTQRLSSRCYHHHQKHPLIDRSDNIDVTKLMQHKYSLLQ
ncbi:hypothetical protein CASFOL_014378 [Castilleja foliolosa]|uniref:Uncharacterized protein n=1 Tax=Castilleja foliolosa TaxID=1961234 RepID=A0ABD3DNA0_9LAMI